MNELITHAELVNDLLESLDKNLCEALSDVDDCDIEAARLEVLEVLSLIGWIG